MCLVLYGIGGLPIFWLAKFVAFDVSSHHLIPALIPEWGALGMGGGVYLYILLALVSFIVAWLAWAACRPKASRLIIGAVLTVVSLPAAWWLAQQGIVPKVQLSNLTVPPLNLWLVPETNGMADSQTVMSRWFIGQIVVMAILVLGAMIPSGPTRQAK